MPAEIQETWLELVSEAAYRLAAQRASRYADADAFRRRRRIDSTAGCAITALAGRHSAVGVFQPDDVVFAQVAARLNLDHFQLGFAGVAQPVHHADGNVG